MGQISIAEAGFAGFGLLGRKPLAVVGWGLVYLVGFFLVFLIVGGALVGALAGIARGGAGALSNPQQMMSMMGGLIGAYVVVLLAALLLGSIIGCAVIRSVLEPEAGGFAYLRLGAQEMFYALNLVVQFFILMGVYIGLAIVLGILVAVTKGNGFVAFLGFLAVVAVMCFFTLKFSLAGPITFAKRGFGLFDSWGATKGQEGALLGVGLLSFIGLIGVAIVMGIIFMIIALAVGGGMASAMQHMGPGANPAAIIGAMGPLLIIYALFITVYYGVATAVMHAPWATAYKQLHPVATQTAQAFA